MKLYNNTNCGGYSLTKNRSEKNKATQDSETAIINFHAPEPRHYTKRFLLLIWKIGSKTQNSLEV